MYSLNGAESCNSTFNNQHSTLLIRLLVCKYVIPHYQVVIAVRSHLFPFRTEKLSSLAPMVLQCGRVGSRLLSSRASITKVVGAFLFSCGFYFLTLIVFCHADFADDADSFAGLFVFYSIISFSQKVNLDFLYYMRGFIYNEQPRTMLLWVVISFIRFTCYFTLLKIFCISKTTLGFASATLFCS